MGLFVLQIAGGDSSWTCIGENVLDVLLEMEKEREKKEMVQFFFFNMIISYLNSIIKILLLLLL